MILEVFGQPWMMTETSLKTLIAIASRDAFFSDVRKQALEARDGAPLKNAHEAYKRGSVAVIPVVGPLIRHADMFSEISGATSYAHLRKDLQAALDDVTTHRILFNIDSPGGEANGCFELADAIYAARSVKPVHAYVGGMGASAAYAIACACETITCAASAELGSIGVRSGYIDDRKALEIHGFKEWVFLASQSPHKGFDVEVEEDRARLQVVLDDLCDVFVGQVARGRGVSVEDVLAEFGKGDVMVGERAVNAGLADRLGNFEATLSELDQNVLDAGAIRAAAKERRMTTKAASATPPAVASMGDEKCDECGKEMSGSAKSYCAACFDDDGDEDDEECSKALGLDAKASRAQRLDRAVSLVKSEAHLLEMTGVKTAAEASGKIAAALADAQALPGVRTELAAEKTAGIKRDLKATLEAGIAGKKLSLGAIQKTIPMVLRGEAKKSWSAAMDKLVADADAAKKTVTASEVIDAACSVAISADDLSAIGEFAKSAQPIAAEPFVEPKRDAASESAELDETAMTIKKAADAARKTLDRNKKPAPAAK